MSRNVTVVATRGNDAVELPDVPASILEELYQVFRDNGIAYEGMKCIEAESQLPLVDPKAKLPVGNFVVYLFPDKAESGILPDDDDEEEDGEDDDEEAFAFEPAC